MPEHLNICSSMLAVSADEVIDDVLRVHDSLRIDPLLVMRFDESGKMIEQRTASYADFEIQHLFRNIVAEGWLTLRAKSGSSVSIDFQGIAIAFTISLSKCDELTTTEDIESFVEKSYQMLKVDYKGLVLAAGFELERNWSTPSELQTRLREIGSLVSWVIGPSDLITSLPPNFHKLTAASDTMFVRRAGAEQRVFAALRT